MATQGQPQSTVQRKNEDKIGYGKQKSVFFNRLQKKAVLNSTEFFMVATG